MEIAIVILNWNGRALLEHFLPSVINHSPQATIYVADNASNDDSVPYLRANFPQVNIIQNKTNGGYAKGYNDALRHLREDILILLNSDVEVTQNWLVPLKSFFTQNPEVAAAQPKILDYNNRNLFEYAGACGGYIDKLGYPYCRGRLFDNLEEDKGQYDEAVPVFWASGACLVIRNKVFRDVEGFDEDYFAHQEEIDLCWRLFNKGYQVWAIPQSVVYHLGGGTLDNMHPRKTFFNFRNSLFSLLKNVSGFKVNYLIFTRLTLDGLAGIKFLLEGKPAHTWAIIRAHFSFYGNLALFLRKRKLVKGRRKYFQRFSVVVAYYLGNRRKFSDL